MTETMTTGWWGSMADVIIDDAGLLLITLDHPDLLEPVRIVSDTMAVVSRGLTFVAWPVLPRLPTHGSAPKRGGITIQNVDPRLGRVIRGLKGNVSCLFEYVSREDPDDVLYEHGGLFLRNFEGSDVAISAEVVGFAVDGQSWPKGSATPERTPGLFVS